MNHSRNVGWGGPPRHVVRPSPDFSDLPLRLWFPRTVKVGNNEDPLTLMRGSRVGR